MVGRTLRFERAVWASACYRWREPTVSGRQVYEFTRFDAMTSMQALPLREYVGRAFTS